jgi:hypothetical protein
LVLLSALAYKAPQMPLPQKGLRALLLLAQIKKLNTSENPGISQGQIKRPIDKPGLPP